MNWIPKTKLWIVKAVQVGRVNSSGSSGPIESSGPIGSNRPAKPGEVCDSKECSGSSKVNFSSEYKESTGAVTAYITEICQWVVKAVQIRKMSGTESSRSFRPSSCKCQEPSGAMTCLQNNAPPPALIDPAYIQTSKIFRKGGVDNNIVKHLKTYFNDQINYHKTMAKTNKAAMKRIKKFQKKWPDTL